MGTGLHERPARVDEGFGMQRRNPQHRLIIDLGLAVADLRDAAEFKSDDPVHASPRRKAPLSPRLALPHDYAYAKCTAQVLSGRKCVESLVVRNANNGHG